jgi:hypothetical protein
MWSSLIKSSVLIADIAHPTAWFAALASTSSGGIPIRRHSAVFTNISVQFARGSCARTRRGEK